MAISPDIRACVGCLLGRRLEILELERRSFPPGGGLAPSVVNSYRLILVCSGVVHYTMEGWSEKIGAGALLLVPAWMKRGWHAGRKRVDLRWISFGCIGESLYQDQPFSWKSDNPVRDGHAFLRMLSIWPVASGKDAAALMIEGELKALLGRLAHGCSRTQTTTASPPPPALPAVNREVIAVAGWIEQHYARPDVLSRAAAMIRSSDHYFRMRFHEHTGFTMSRYATMVRMRRARYLLSSSSAPVKEVAWQVGFHDPLHFSRCYRKFWGRAPRLDRQ
jgi:AraC-like DNA-binding protein